MTWTVIVNDSFARANAALSANPGSVGNGWIDSLGSTWGINSNMLFGTVSNFNAIAGQVILRQPSENAISQRITATFVYTTPGTTPRGCAVARWQDANNFYYATLSNTSGFHLAKYIGGASTDLATAVAFSAVAGDSYTIDLQLVGSNPTVITAVVTNNTTSATQTLTGSDSAAALQVAAPVGVDAWSVVNGTAATIDYTNITTYSYSSGGTNTVGIVPVTTQTGSYTFTLTDAGQVADFNSSSAGTFTIPTNASVNFAVGTVLGFRYIGTGALTIAGSSGVTLDGTLSLSQYQTGFAHQIATNVWVLSV